MIVVSDTSPIRALAFLQQLSLLERFFHEVWIPPAVERELREPPLEWMAVDPGQFPFMRVESPKDQNHVADLLAELDLGESEALVLALENSPEAFLIDELRGRGKAIQLGLKVTGTVGVLIRAKAEGLIEQLRPLLDRLENELGFFISPNLRAEALRLAGE